MTKTVALSPNVDIDILTDGDRLLGVGKVTVGGIAIRDGLVPIRPDFSTPDAIHYQDFVLLDTEQSEAGIVLHTQAIGRPDLYGEMMDEYSYNLAFVSVRQDARDRLDWIIKPAELELDGEHYIGLSIGFRFVSAQREIHRFTTITTWEIGAQAAGNTVYHQSYTCPPVYTATTANHFSTTCLKQLDLWDSWLGNSYQMLPRWGAIQPFDFQASDAGVLLGYWPEKHSIKSLIQKNQGETVIFAVDEYDFALTKEIDISPKHILFSAGKRQKHQIVNMWTRATDYTTQIIRDFFGITHCLPLPAGRPAYNGRKAIKRWELELGDQPDRLWTVENGEFFFRIEGEKIARRDFLYWLADNTLPKQKALGHTRVMFEPIHESDFTQDAFANHAETGWHGDLTVCSICGSRRYVPAECYDGWRGWNYLADKARKLDMSLGHWVGLHLTPRAPILQEHPEYAIKHVNTLGHSGGYSHLSIKSINFASGARQWFLDDMKRWHDEGGLEWLFFDSWPNLGCSPLNYGGRMEPMQWEMGSLLADLQAIGYNWFSFEGTSPFGVHQYGLWDPMEDYENHTAGGVMGQNDFDWWIGHEYMGYNQMLGPKVNAKRDRNAMPELSFRYAANRSLTMVQEHNENNYPYTPGLDQTYRALLPLMQTRHLLPDDRGVRWESDTGATALFAFKAFDWPVPAGSHIYTVESGTSTPVPLEGTTLRTAPLTAYKLTH